MAKYSVSEILRRIQRNNPWYDRAEFATDPVTPGSRVSGVNVSGYLRDESGLGEAARGYIRALESLQVPVALNDLSELTSNRSEDRTLTKFDTNHPYDVNLLCIDAGQHYSVMRRLGEGYFEGRYNIGVWAWELPRFPERWYDCLAYYDEIWVATSFIANMLALISPIPVVRIPPVLTARKSGSRGDGRRRLGVPDEEFVFLFIFDFHSHLQRKNPLALIDAFKMAFAPSEMARLVIKCVNAESDPDGFAAMEALARGHRVSTHAGYWTADEMADLMAACDVYVSMHRSEGTGLTITDAMAVGKPVIATAWSGNMDFMNISNSFPVRYELIRVEKSVGPYRAGEVWADPSVEHAAELMRLAFEDRQEAQARGERARRDIEANYSVGKVADLIEQRLDVIASRHLFPLLKREMKAFTNGYEKLSHEIQTIVRSVVPPGSTVIVVSKGDNELLDLDGRHAWHFPRGEDGKYAGYYPADSAEAIDHLEALRGKGGDFLLLPGTAFWWLDYYVRLRRHLDDRYRRVWGDERCIIYRLYEPGLRRGFLSSQT